MLHGLFASLFECTVGQNYAGLSRAVNQCHAASMGRGHASVTPPDSAARASPQQNLQKKK